MFHLSFGCQENKSWLNEISYAYYNINTYLHMYAFNKSRITILKKICILVCGLAFFLCLFGDAL